MGISIARIVRGFRRAESSFKQPFDETPRGVPGRKSFRVQLVVHGAHAIEARRTEIDRGPRCSRRHENTYRFRTAIDRPQVVHAEGDGASHFGQ